MQASVPALSVYSCWKTHLHRLKSWEHWHNDVTQLAIACSNPHASWYLQTLSQKCTGWRESIWGGEGGTREDLAWEVGEISSGATFCIPTPALGPASSAWGSQMNS